MPLVYIPNDFPIIPLFRVIAEHGYEANHWHSSIAGQTVLIVTRRDLEQTMRRVQEGLEVYVSE